MAFLLCVEFSD
ncbi:hypothetical protein L3X65_26025 [Vibrio diabolicus]|nr:hypothetical protein [Vibrio alginolyticus]MCG9232567.1 hypothetical protein [Vibrio diabolicus]MCG9679139.1 hypothetical protein [Vibrio sp. Isolate24]MCG9574468.1 hypothetical protein [Vibrio diabolicus]MCG9593630.1 hypothetical protein [Vibrio diabolicus]